MHIVSQVIKQNYRTMKARITMNNHTIEGYLLRITLLESRTDVDNKRIIAKLRRKIRALETAL